MYDALLIIAIGLALIVGAVALSRTTDLKDARRRDLIRAELMRAEVDELKRRP